MKKTLLLGVTAITLALTSSTARAGDVRVSFHVGLPLPRLCVPAPPSVCVTPPVCVTRPVVYVQSGYCHPGFTYRGHRGHPKFVRGHVNYHRHVHHGRHRN